MIIQNAKLVCKLTWACVFFLLIAALPGIAAEIAAPLRVVNKFRDHIFGGDLEVRDAHTVGYIVGLRRYSHRLRAFDHGGSAQDQLSDYIGEDLRRRPQAARRRVRGAHQQRTGQQNCCQEHNRPALIISALLYHCFHVPVAS